MILLGLTGLNGLRSLSYLHIKANIDGINANTSSEATNVAREPIGIRGQLYKLLRAVTHVFNYAWVCLFVLGILFTIFGNYNHSPNARSSQPSTHQNQSKNKPIPKSNVQTQYSKDEPLLNNNGLCELTVDNSKNDMPVYVRIWDISTQTPIRAFTINGSEQFTAKNVSPGNYEIRYKELYEDDYPVYGAKTDPVELEQIDFDDGTQYSTVRLTLYKVINGNANISQIPVDDI